MIFYGQIKQNVLIDFKGPENKICTLKESLYLMPEGYNLRDIY